MASTIYSKSCWFKKYGECSIVGKGIAMLSKARNICSVVVVVVALLFYVHGKHLRSCRDGQLT